MLARKESSQNVGLTPSLFQHHASSTVTCNITYHIRFMYGLQYIAYGEDEHGPPDAKQQQGRRVPSSLPYGAELQRQRSSILVE